MYQLYRTRKTEEEKELLIYSFSMSKPFKEVLETKADYEKTNNRNMVLKIKVDNKHLEFLEMIFNQADVISNIFSQIKDKL